MGKKSKSIIKFDPYALRRRFNTTWILESAIQNPNVIIVFQNAMMSDRQQKNYNKLLAKLNLPNLAFGPIFTHLGALEYYLAGSHFPVIFDLSCYEVLQNE